MNNLSKKENIRAANNQDMSVSGVRITHPLISKRKKAMHIQPCFCDEYIMASRLLPEPSTSAACLI
jgi:hypothetical protein